MDAGRFSLLLLEPGEIYFEDFSAVLIPVDTTPKTFDFKKQCGRLKLCSKSLVFDPKDIQKPLVKIPLKDCNVLEQWKGSAKFLKSNNVLSVHCKQFIEMLDKNIIAPYKFVDDGNFLFLLNYANITDCLPRISQLQRASTLPAAEHADMIATIVHSRQARVGFDQMWLDLYETSIMETQADKVTPLVINPGRILLSNTRLYFQPYNNIETYPVIKINLSNIKKLFKRRFLLRQIGLEIYSNENDTVPHLYLSFRTPTDRDKLYDTLLEQPELKLNNIQQDVMTLQWQNGIISNYEYLLYVNSQADRTSNDLTQYPVFPWIISDYHSSKLNLEDPDSFRDLSKPVGALNDLRLQRLLERYEEMSHPKFLYGSHYSTPGFVLFYLVRLYPHYMLCLQNGRFDHPDRMFNSVADVYKNCLNNLSDFKELVPEFFDVEKGGKFLVNEMGIDFGHRHNGIKVGDVELPPWADSPKDFVKKLREALESEIVSNMLNHWIDLIFGYKQRGEEAIAAKNLFYHLCYEGSVNLEAITDLNQRHALEVQIMEFGQIPKQIFKVPHPKRKSGLQILKEPSIIETNVKESKYVKSWNSSVSLQLKTSFKTHKASISCIIFGEDNDKIISVGCDAKMKMFSISLNRQIRSANIGTMPLSSCAKLPNMNVLVIGSFDNNIILYDLDFGKITQNVTAHEDAVICLAWGYKAGLLASGSGDCTIRLWKGISTGNIIKPVQCLMTQLDHSSQVTSLTFDPKNKFLASGTEDGEIYIWEIESLSLVKKTVFHTSSVRAIRYSSDGQKFASCGDDGLFQIVDINTGMALLHKIFPHPLKCLQWNDFLLVLGSNSGVLHVWNTDYVVCLGEKQAHEGAVKTVDISQDKKQIITGGEDYRIKVWQLL